MRLALLAVCAFSELVESITCVFSMGPLRPNPTLTAISKSLSINSFSIFVLPCVPTMHCISL
jgi:hypothetical protein